MMEIAVLFFLSSGLFLGWSLGANDAANVFGTAVGTRMVRFATAAAICSLFVILGAVISGAGAAHTLGRLGAINALAGSFMVAFAAAFSVYLMTKAGLTVSTTQAIVGAVIGWNLFTGTATDSDTLVTLMSTWLICPLLAAGIAAALYKLVVFLLRRVKPHLLRLDAYTRLGLILAGAFGAYSLGANNIANVVGVFVPSIPFRDFNLIGFGTFSAAQQLFLLGGLAIAAGVITYSKRVMLTVGRGLLPLSPIAAWVAVVAHSIVLFVFASRGLEHFLASRGLPSIPLVPVSSSQAVVGAVLGIGLIKGGRAIRWNVLGGIGFGWVVTPIIACGICFVGLFFLQNVFGQQVYRQAHYMVTAPLLQRLEKEGIAPGRVQVLSGELFVSARRLDEGLRSRTALSAEERRRVVELAERVDLYIDPGRFGRIDRGWLTAAQIAALKRLAGRRYLHEWSLAEALAAQSDNWRFRPRTAKHETYNIDLERKLNWIFRLFREGG